MDAAIDLAHAVWRKSSYSNGEGGACVEVADGFSAVLPVRDSKDTERSPILVSRTEWTSFVAAVKDGMIAQS